MEKYLDAELSPKERAEDLIARMSLEEKMGQVNCLFPFGDNWESLEKDAEHGIGEVSGMEMREAGSLEDAAAWQRKVQKMVMEKSEHHIPASFHMEGVCGAFIKDATSYPSGIARGASWDPELEEQIGRSVARQETACGITRILAPILDVSRDSRLGRQGETYGEDPTLASAMGIAYTKGIQAEKTGGRRADSTAKHFLGFHNSQAGIHGAVSDTPERLLQEIYGKPFQAAIRDASLRGIMPCYNVVNGKPVSASAELLTGLLREDMGFEGVCTSDYLAVSNVYNVQHVGESMEEAGYMCMEAGMDVEMQQRCAFSKELEDWFRTGKADMAVLDRAVLRVLEAKFCMGLFEHPYALEGRELGKVFYSKKDRELSLQSALESMVLLKNNGALPLNKKIKKLAVIGCHAGNARSFFGGYTNMSMHEAGCAIANSIAGFTSGSMEGTDIPLVPGTQIQSDETEQFRDILKSLNPQCKNLLDELEDVLKDTEIIYAYGYPIAGNDLSHMGEGLEAVRKADAVILTLGGKYSACSVATTGEGVDSTDINLPYCQEEFIRRAAEYGKPLIGIHLDGRPVSSDAADQYLDALLEAWNPAETGAEAIVKVLTGAYCPGGKMPVCTARCAGQEPIYYNHSAGSYWHQGSSIGFNGYVNMPHEPRYFFGYGLSYTAFKYSNLYISKQEINPYESTEISVDIENTGTYDGDEIVQMYFSDVRASMVRPVKELAGFQRISLKAGETKTIVFSVDASQTAFLDKNMKWKIEKGTLEIQIGSSSEDIRQTVQVYIKEDALIRGRDRSFVAKAHVE